MQEMISFHREASVQVQALLVSGGGWGGVWGWGCNCKTGRLSASSLLQGPEDRASLFPHRLPMRFWPGALGPAPGGWVSHTLCLHDAAPAKSKAKWIRWMATTDQSFTQTDVGENELLGREEATGYLPPNADKQGQPVTEQKGGSHRQKENNKKAHLNHSSESQPRQSTGKHTGSGEKGTCFSGRGFPGSVDTNSVVLWDGCRHDPLWKATAQGQSHQCWGVWLHRVGSG